MGTWRNPKPRSFDLKIDELSQKKFVSAKNKDVNFKKTSMG